MKTSFGPTTRPLGDRAFTLVELLTVMAIIATLVGLTVGVLTVAQKSSNEKLALNQLNLIKQGLTKYNEKYGEYPPHTLGSSDSRGGQILYQALTGDGDSLLGGQHTSDGKLNEEENQESISYRVISPESDNYGLIGKDGENQYTLSDPFDNPWQYRTFDKDTPSATHNNTYDLWSFGGDKTGEDETKWIKNWKVDD